MAETVHFCPRKGGLMPCCGRTPFEVPRTDLLSEDPTAVTCWPRGSFQASWVEFDAAVRSGLMMLARAFGYPLLKRWTAWRERR